MVAAAKSRMAIVEIMIMNPTIKKLILEERDEKLFDAIRQRSSIAFERYIFSLGIRQVGQATARLLAHAYGDFPSWRKAMIAAKDEESEAYRELFPEIATADFSVLADFAASVQLILQECVIAILSQTLEPDLPYKSNAAHGPSVGRAPKPDRG